MNCPKCNSPLNEGDKFCQTCGTLVSPENKPEENVPEAMPVVNNEPTEQVVQPVNQNMDFNNQPNVGVQPQQPMNDMGYTQMPVNNMNQPMNYAQQPMNSNLNSNVQNEPKKNNTVVFVLMAVILVLLAVVIFLIVTSGKDEDKTNNTDKDNEVVNVEKDDNEEKEEDDNDEEEIVTAQYTKTNVNEFTFELPEGYNAGYYNDNVMFYDEYMTDVQGVVMAVNGYYSSMDKEQMKVSFASFGVENITLEEKQVNNKNMVILSGEYEDYIVELIFLEYSYSKVIGAEVYYTYGTNETKEDVYEIISRLSVDDTAFSTTTNIKVPGLDISSFISQ